MYDYVQDGGHYGILIETISVYLLSTGNLDTSNEVSSKLAFLINRNNWKYFFKMVAVVAMLDFRSERQKLFLIYKSSRNFL